MIHLRRLAIAGALALMIGELSRSWGAGRHPLFILDDMLAGGFMLAAAWAMRRDTVRNRAAFAAAWGVATGMLYGSFFGKLVEPATAQAGNWNVTVLIASLGAAFVIALAGLWLSITLPEAMPPRD
jgi:hypothetical protein